MRFVACVFCERARMFLLGACVLQSSIHSDNLYLPQNAPFGAICSAKCGVNLNFLRLFQVLSPPKKYDNKVWN